MLGFSPPSQEVAPPPRVKRHDMLIHVDRVKDWSPLSSRSSHSVLSGLSSSRSDDGRSVPAHGLCTSRTARAMGSGTPTLRPLGAAEVYASMNVVSRTTTTMTRAAGALGRIL